MKSDARLLLNKKKWNKGPGNRKPDIWKNRGTVDARKILNLKRRQKSNTPVLGSYMRTKTATALIASQIRKEISPTRQAPNKVVEILNDGNIVINKSLRTSQSKNASQVTVRNKMPLKMNVGLSSGSRRIAGERMQFETSSTATDDLEHAAVDDILDFDALPSAYVATKSFPNTNVSLSRKSAMNQVLNKRHTMVADQLAECSGSHKVYVANLHPSVTQQDVMELFGDVGIIRSVEMLLPGTAAIDFYDENDAAKACDIYHNRLLDGLPMKCYMPKDSRQNSALSQRLGERVIAPYINASQTPSPPMVANSRSRCNPRNVQFTVKLT